MSRAVPPSPPPSPRLRPPHRRRDPHGLQPRAFDLLEEAVHLLRSLHAGTWAIYYAGAGAWVLGFLFFWAHATWFAPGPAQLAWFALGLTGLFAGLKLAQAFFCAHLLARRMGTTPPAFELRQTLRIAFAQLRGHAWGFLALPLAAVVTLPLGWMWAFYQNLTVLAFAAAADDARKGRTNDADGRTAATLTGMALEEARLWPGQNHLALGIISLLVLWIAAVVAGSFFVLPWLANRLLGIENSFGLSGWSWFNTTFFACIAALTWLAVDPLIKAFYTLRVFYGRARRNGEDLLIELASANRIRQRRTGRPALRVAPLPILLLAAIVALALPLPCPAGEATPPTSQAPAATVVEPQALDRAIDTALDQSAFRWRLRPLPHEMDADDKPDSPLMAFLKQGVKAVSDFFSDVSDAIGRFIEWLERLLGIKKPDRTSSAEPFSLGSLSWVRAVLYGLIAILVLVLAWAVIRLWLRRRQLTASSLRARAVVEIAAPDLRDEDVQAAQLPADAWETLAREQLALGEWRLALRALYLATLARLGADGWLALARHKTNADYETELRRRASQHGRLVAWFGGRRREFEAVWYGRADTTEAQVRGWLADLNNDMKSP
ncbi:hypothetical protein [Geminisphaera colitermitum]|uniref:hypothetical protein n=1 Tax=Geminisphaera colitermitum TaxID=1148786 RepID=UPI000158D4A9|nr:hypothetical protein [Geminisphaera colitermitum]